ncbi:DUF4440 domain-containing protein [Robiginitalea sp. SC105]|uniref:YybH family protein n=1 Tax=Robiginitalea sp. SC105 TaxID=2762332 RepID=UPI00163AE63C|nr:nuclear transport factor 2 family protein [Robiginitalea sp. SC105]MBC2839954.1 nuclear transport factor 2 family protein [Robiginitalea sp. SC105]
MKSFIVAFSLLSLFVSCNESAATAPDPEEQARMAARETEAARQEIEAINEKVTTLMAEGKFEEAGQYFAEDLVQLIAGQPPINGRAQWIEAQKQASAIGDWGLELEVLDFRLAGDVAVERGRGVQTFTANENSPIPSMETTGDYLVYWVKTDSGWQIQWDYVVLETPPQGDAGME